jgi:hypothetical protein
MALFVSNRRILRSFGVDFAAHLDQWQDQGSCMPFIILLLRVRRYQSPAAFENPRTSESVGLPKVIPSVSYHI